MSRLITLFAAGLLFALAACSNMNQTEQRVVSGTAIGAGAGAALVAVTGGLSIGTGALIGAGVGAAGGYVVDQTQSN